ncbi:MAG TPA: YCF48-related protein, partial [Ignavibacteria bacterium]|nr:YCF48-related protein [Ignavibacteria bacterium]
LQINSGLTEDLYHILYLTNDTFFVCGNNGKVLCTFNGGLTWLNRSPFTNHNLNFIHKYYNSENKLDGIWIVGDNGTIIYTKDFGVTWLNSASGTNMD